MLLTIYILMKLMKHGTLNLTQKFTFFVSYHQNVNVDHRNLQNKLDAAMFCLFFVRKSLSIILLPF